MKKGKKIYCYLCGEPVRNSTRYYPMCKNGRHELVHECWERLSVSSEQTETNTMPEPVIVKNEDIITLANVLSIMQEVKGIERRREWQNERMYSIKAQRITGMPGGGGGTPSGLEASFSLLSELDAEHEQSCRSYVRELRKAERILNGITSISMRTFVMMKYVMDIPDSQIQKELGMTRRKFERAKRCIEDAETMSMVKWQERYILDRNT